MPYLVAEPRRTPWTRACWSLWPEWTSACPWDWYCGEEGERRRALAWSGGPAPGTAPAGPWSVGVRKGRLGSEQVCWGKNRHVGVRASLLGLRQVCFGYTRSVGVGIHLSLHCRLYWSSLSASGDKRATCDRGLLEIKSICKQGNPSFTLSKGYHSSTLP